MPPRNKIRNPILRGFNPDPSVCRVGDDYYVAVSTFEWYPAIQIYHSRDLEQWRRISSSLVTTAGMRCAHEMAWRSGCPMASCRSA